MAATAPSSPRTRRRARARAARAADQLRASTSISTEVGSVISTDGKPCPAGEILLRAELGSVNVAGVLSSEKPSPARARYSLPGGGPITVIARCDLTVDGTIRSTGLDAGADLIHLEGGCHVVINGLVKSTAAATAFPIARRIIAMALRQRPTPPALHPGRQAAELDGVIEVWAGDSLVISATAELNADVGLSGDNDGISWVDLFARAISRSTAHLHIALPGARILFLGPRNGIGGSGVTARKVDRQSHVHAGLGHGERQGASGLDGDQCQQLGRRSITVEALE